MPCESYKTAITEAAAGAPATSALRSHLIVCADCRSALADEERLFASIDAGLHSVANAEAPVSLVPSVRSHLATVSAPQRTWLGNWAWAGLGTAALVATVLCVQIARQVPKSNSSDSRASQNQQPSQQLPKSALPVATAPSIIPNQGATRSAYRRSRVNMPSLPSEPEIIVSRDQEILLAEYAEAMRHNHGGAVVSPTQAQETVIADLVITPIQIPQLDVKPITEEKSR
jgi:hypothetical protein